MDAQSRQIMAMREALAGAQKDREGYHRLCILMARALMGEGDVMLVEDGVGFSVTEFSQVPKVFQSSFAIVDGAEADEEGNIPDDAVTEQMVIFQVSRSEHENNGNLIVPQSRLQLP